MAIFRKVHVTFWEDVFVDSLTPERKLFFLYLLTNSKTTQCGIYELAMSKMKVETGYNQDSIEKFLDYFVETGKILVSKSTKEIAIKNWRRYNDYAANRKVQACIDKELKQVKNRELVAYVDSDR